MHLLSSEQQDIWQGGANQMGVFTSQGFLPFMQI